MYLGEKEEEVKTTKERMQSIFADLDLLHRGERRWSSANNRRYDKWIGYQLIDLEAKEEEVKQTKERMQSNYKLFFTLHRRERRRS